MKPSRLLFILALIASTIACTFAVPKTQAISADSLATAPDISPTASDISPTASQAQREICAEHLNLRAAAGISADILAVLKNGENVKLTGETSHVDGSTWVQVKIDRGSSGWLNASYLCPGN